MRTTELTPAAASYSKAQSATAEGVDASPTADQRPCFASIHTLLKRADSLAELPEGKASIWIRDANAILNQHPGDRHPAKDLLQWINMGWVYVLWDQRYAEFDELDSGWPRQTTARTMRQRLRAMRAKALLAQREKLVHETDCD